MFIQRRSFGLRGASALGIRGTRTLVHPSPEFTTVHSTFVKSEDNVHGRLIRESARKTGVATDLPPQLPPEGNESPYYPPSLQEELASSSQPLSFDPPSIESTGRSRLEIPYTPLIKPKSGASAIATPATSSSLSQQSSSGPVQRKSLHSFKVQKKRLMEAEIKQQDVADLMQIWDKYGKQRFDEASEETKLEQFGGGETTGGETGNISFKAADDIKMVSVYGEEVAKALSGAGVAERRRQKTLARLGINYFGEDSIRPDAVRPEEDIFVSPFVRPASMTPIAERIANETTRKEALMAKKRGLKPFECRICGKRFRNKEGLVSHYQVTHNQPMPPDQHDRVRSIILSESHGIATDINQQKKEELSQRYAPVSLEEANEALNRHAPLSSAKRRKENKPYYLNKLAKVPNVQLSGVVKQVESGFLRNVPVVQIRLEVNSSLGTGAEDGSENAIDRFTIQHFGPTTFDVRSEDQILVSGSLTYKKKSLPTTEDDEINEEGDVGKTSSKEFMFPIIVSRPPFGQMILLKKG